MADERGPIQRIGCRISDRVAHLSADPLAQIGFILVCVAWFWAGLNVNILTAALSIMAITLTQMVLNSQRERERDAHRRDVALHAKLDELLIASRRARDELAGIEELEEEEIEELKNGGAGAAASVPPDGAAGRRPRRGNGRTAGRTGSPARRLEKGAIS
ncbi:MAG: low affinity iron permease family protein [Sphingomonadaceae bacterium]|nr:low affinity iron permease family protein [Sphingomonadaceae bacterium]